MMRPNAHGFFPPRDMKHYHRVEKIMQARCLFQLTNKQETLCAHYC